MIKKTTALAFAALLLATTFSAHAMEEENPYSKTFRQTMLGYKKDLSYNKRMRGLNLSRKICADVANRISTQNTMLRLDDILTSNEYLNALAQKETEDNEANAQALRRLQKHKETEQEKVDNDRQACERYITNPFEEEFPTEEERKILSQEDLKYIHETYLPEMVEEKTKLLTILRNQKEVNEKIFQETIEGIEQESVTSARDWRLELDKHISSFFWK